MSEKSELVLFTGETYAAIAEENPMLAEAMHYLTLLETPIEGETGAMRRPTRQEVARWMGISLATLDRRVRDWTANKVLEQARQLMLILKAEYNAAAIDAVLSAWPDLVMRAIHIAKTTENGKVFTDLFRLLKQEIVDPALGQKPENDHDEFDFINKRKKVRRVIFEEEQQDGDRTGS
jgi:hypothetical protein